MRILLASESPRRAQLLAAAGYEFDIAPADVDERADTGETPSAYVGRLAEAKVAAVASREPERLVLGADTAVVVDDEILGKPADEMDATRMLERLSGRTHDVLTGVAIRWRGQSAGAVDLTRVRFICLRADQIAWYIASGEPAGKAGAYAIQGIASRFIDRIEGSYSNVMGLPLATVSRLLAELGANREPRQ